MKTLMELLNADTRISDYKINLRSKESYELFFVKGALETVRCTDTCDKEVTVYVAHGDCKGEAQFFVYPSTTDEQLSQRIAEAVEKALLINNRTFDLPAGETGSFSVESNFAAQEPLNLASEIAKTVFEANEIENASLNSVEIFLNKRTDRILNSRGLDKTQVRYDAMVEAIPTYTGQCQSVELYEQYNFGALDVPALRQEISEKMAQVKARYEAETPAFPIDCPVVLNAQEISELTGNIAHDLNYATVYVHSNLFKKGEAIQKNPEGDLIGITMDGQVAGCIHSSFFDSDGLELKQIRLVEAGKVVNYYGANRYGQYLQEAPTGNLPCLILDAGTAGAPEGNYLEVVSMSGLQVDFYSDYIGGEVRLAYYCDGETVTPVTGISISGQLSQVLERIRFSSETTVFDDYSGPSKAILSDMKIF